MMITGNPNHRVIDILPETSSATHFEQSDTAAARPDAVLLEMTHLNAPPVLLLGDDQKARITQNIAAHYSSTLLQRVSTAQKKQIFAKTITLLRRDAVIEHCSDHLRSALGHLTQPRIVEAKCSEGIIDKIMHQPLPSDGMTVNSNFHAMQNAKRVALTRHYRNAALVLRSAFHRQHLDTPSGRTAVDFSSPEYKLARKLLGNATVALSKAKAELSPAEILNPKIGELVGQVLPQLAPLHQEINTFVDSELQRRLTQRPMPIISELRSAAKSGIAALASGSVAVGSTLGAFKTAPKLGADDNLWHCSTDSQGHLVGCSQEDPKINAGEVALYIGENFGSYVGGTAAIGSSMLTARHLFQAARVAWAQRALLPLESAALTPIVTSRPTDP